MIANKNKRSAYFDCLCQFLGLQRSPDDCSHLHNVSDMHVPSNEAQCPPPESMNKCVYFIWFEGINKIRYSFHADISKWSLSLWLFCLLPLPSLLSICFACVFSFIRWFRVYNSVVMANGLHVCTKIVVNQIIVLQLGRKFQINEVEKRPNKGTWNTVNIHSRYCRTYQNDLKLKVKELAVKRKKETCIWK